MFTGPKAPCYIPVGSWVLALNQENKKTGINGVTKRSSVTFFARRKVILCKHGIFFDILIRITFRPKYVKHIYLLKIIYVNCSWRSEYRGDPRSYEQNLSSSRNKVWKKFRPVRAVKRCTGIGEVMSSNPIQAWIFLFRPYYHYYYYYCYLSSVHNCEDRFHIDI